MISWSKIKVHAAIALLSVGAVMIGVSGVSAREPGSASGPGWTSIVVLHNPVLMQPIVPVVPLPAWRTIVRPGPRAGLKPIRAKRGHSMSTGSISRETTTAHTKYRHALQGIASYYWQDQLTASGERFNKRALTAAHKTLPLGTKVKVTDVESGRSVVVRINDRGPFKPGRVVDLSERAAEVLGFTGRGLTKVLMSVMP